MRTSKGKNNPNESLDLLLLRGIAMAEPVTLVNGDISPKFSALDSKGIKHDLDEIMASGKSTILYFYPKDSTPGCTVQACDFRDDMARLTSEVYQVFGV